MVSSQASVMRAKAPVTVPPERNFNEIRPLGIDICVSTSASGSSYITLGETKVKCCVNAPRPCNKKLLHETGILNIVVHFSTSEDQKRIDFDLVTVLTELFERHVLLHRYPHQSIDAWITVEENDGGLFPACVIGLFLAFADCGIQMLDVIAAASVFAFEKEDGSLQLILDLNAEEEAYYRQLYSGLGRVHLAYCPNLNTVAYLLCTGSDINYESFQKMATMAQAACDVIAVEIKGALVDHVEWKSQETPVAMESNSICPEIRL